ncbi:seminal plasma acrosin inhibitor A1-like [Suricata suricatta]|uniref:seminal plasma acrosin inhibitor A1-like n=1 Tax=Suricata suricatta TaxID=37032 RepID=UPI0011554EAA|nr:seminal plasma acrosin inhibitor A1-like [Suricata suricatta]
MSFLLIWIKAIFITVLAFPHYSEAGFEPPEPNSFQPNCIKYISQVNDCKGEMDPICGTNGRTYPNICVFCSELFAASGAFTFSHYGKCAA